MWFTQLEEYILAVIPGRVVTVVSGPTLAVSRHIRAEVRGYEHGRVGAQMPRHVDGHVRGTDVAQGPLALNARTWHMGPLALDVWDVAKRGDPGI